MNPKLVWCYSAESMMKYVRPLVHSSANGSTAQGMDAKASEKWLRAIDFELSDPEEWIRTFAMRQSD